MVLYLRGYLTGKRLRTPALASASWYFFRLNEFQEIGFAIHPSTYVFLYSIYLGTCQKNCWIALTFSADMVVLPVLFVAEEDTDEIDQSRGSQPVHPNAKKPTTSKILISHATRRAHRKEVTPPPIYTIPHITNCHTPQACHSIRQPPLKQVHHTTHQNSYTRACIIISHTPVHAAQHLFTTLPRSTVLYTSLL